MLSRGRSQTKLLLLVRGVLPSSLEGAKLFIANAKGTSVKMSVPEDGLKDRCLERPPRVRRVAPKGSSCV